MSEHPIILNDAMAALARYELAPAANQKLETLSGGQQARLQILLLARPGPRAGPPESGPLAREAHAVRGWRAVEPSPGWLVSSDAPGALWRQLPA
ncbi:hypothetical protein ACQP2T_13590 [Nonomuraea sp. CA-143628]|uniref:hypothetical protein n=1 Tax=Nonomuraea sp. CA-143628 TaxID=3239997 RepID=UPI003D8ACEC1